MRLPLILLFTLSGFSAWGQGKSTTVGSGEQSVQRAAEAFVEAFNNLEWERFRNTFADDATIFFPGDVRSRVNGREEIEARFRPMFDEGKKRGGGPPYLHILPKDMKIQMAGDAAIVTFHLGAESRRTIVWQKRGGKWLIVHLHASVQPALEHSVKAPEAEVRQRKIVFDSQRDGNRDIYVMDRDGSGVRRLTQTSGPLRLSWKPKWSPDGERIAFQSNRNGAAASSDLESLKQHEIYVMSASGRNLRRLTDNDEADLDPAWSPDGNKLAFTSHRNGTPEVYVMEADGGNVRRLTSNDIVDREPVWSPDGSKIAFESHRDGNPEIYVMDADGGNVRRLTQNPEADAGADWSPDGSRIAFRSLRHGTLETYVMDSTGGDVRSVTHDSRSSYRANWSGDGREFVFVSTRDTSGAGPELGGGEYEIYVMNSDGSNVRRLTHNQVFDGHPDW